MNKKITENSPRGYVAKLLKAALIAGVASCATLGNAWAISVAGNSVGIFVSPVAGADNPSMSVSGVGTSTFYWGAGGDASSVHYQNVPFSSLPETPFTIGTLSYYNGTIDSGTGADGVGLNLDVNFSLPSGVNQNFLYAMQLINTPNTFDSTGSADYLILSTFPNAVFEIAGTTYTLTLGFQNLQGGGFLQSGNQLHVLEGENATADLIGTITTDTSGVTGVPDAASTLGLLGCSMALLATIRRKLVG